jgi:hypothetical protein
MANRLDVMYERYQKKIVEDRGVLAPVVREVVLTYVERSASSAKACCEAGWRGFAEWVGKLRDDDDRFTTLATFGTTLAGRLWSEIINDYLNTNAMNDSFDHCVVNWFCFAERPGDPGEHFDRLFDLILLDALGCASYDPLASQATVD